MSPPQPKQQLYNCNNGTIVIIEKVYRDYSKKVLLIINREGQYQHSGWRGFHEGLD